MEKLKINVKKKQNSWDLSGKHKKSQNNKIHFRLHRIHSIKRNKEIHFTLKKSIIPNEDITSLADGH
jgi:hypothetical protein